MWTTGLLNTTLTGKNILKPVSVLIMNRGNKIFMFRLGHQLFLSNGLLLIYHVNMQNETALDMLA